MTWLTWRQFRASALSVYAALAAVGVALAITGPELTGRTDFSDQEFLFAGTAVAVYLLPAVVGVFWGVPVVTRELEAGTHLLVWNQTVTRQRWLANKLLVGGVAATAAAGLLSLAVSLWAGPIDDQSAESTQGEFMARVSPAVFAARGVAPIGYAAFAFVLGVAVGILLRRTVAAMAVTLALFAVVQVAVPLFVRPHVLPAVAESFAVTTDNIEEIVGDESGLIERITVTRPAGAWVLTNETVDAAGEAVVPLPDFVQDCVPGPGDRGRPFLLDCFTRLGDQGYAQSLVYHPASRFWPLQWIELGIFLALSALLTRFCFTRLRRLS